MSQTPTILWFRHDLRLADHPALRAAIDRGGPVIPAFVWSPDEEGTWPPGAASRWWLHHSLAELSEQLQQRSLRLTLRRGAALAQLQELAEETGASAVFWGRRYEPAAIERDTRVKTGLKQLGIVAESFNTSLLHEPWDVQTKEGRPYQVFTPFYKACLAAGEPAAPLPTPRQIAPPRQWPQSLSLDELELQPKPNWANGFAAIWQPGESGAAQRLTQWIRGEIGRYLDQRNRPDLEGVSCLSPHLHFGEVSPRQVWHAVGKLKLATPRSNHAALDGYLQQVLWREFAFHLLYHFPHTTEQPLRSKFAEFPWRSDRQSLRAWQRGQTGYPIVDAAMRQLWQTGWMHNRVRMIVASFLVKDLLVSWQEGARWFWDTLVDADLANNALGWQWTAGCGADAAPYFRVFNPVSQGEKFDPRGDYVRRWVPELANLPAAWIHQPWQAPVEVLRSAGVELGKSYPHPLVDHAEARKRALEALAKCRMTSEAGSAECGMGSAE